MHLPFYLRERNQCWIYTVTIYFFLGGWRKYFISNKVFAMWTDIYFLEVMRMLLDWSPGKKVRPWTSGGDYLWNGLLLKCWTFRSNAFDLIIEITNVLSRTNCGKTKLLSLVALVFSKESGNGGKPSPSYKVNFLRNNLSQ